MKRAFRIFNWGLLSIAIPVIISIIIFSIFKLIFGWNSVRTWYWLAMSDLSQIVLAFIILLPISLLYIVIVKIIFKGNDRQQNISAATVLLMLAAFMLLCAASWIAPVFQTGILGYREHIESVQLNRHKYHLHFFSPNPVEGYGDRYILYECDSMDILCKEIHSELRTHGGIVPEVEEIVLVADHNEQAFP